MQMNNSELKTRAGDRRAFTVVELLVVLAILSVLAMTVLAGTSGDVSKRLACSDNLRRLISATQSWATDNGGVYPNDGHQQTYAVSQNFRNTMTNSYKLERKNFYCPSNPGWNTDSSWNSANTILGYSYFAGFPAYNTSNTIGTYYPANGALPGGDNLRAHLPVLPMNLTDQAYYPILWTDLTTRSLGSWQGSLSSPPRANHFGSSKPLGLNEGYFDGSVEWADFAKFSTQPKMIVSSVDIFFYAGKP